MTITVCLLAIWIIEASYFMLDLHLYVAIDLYLHSSILRGRSSEYYNKGFGPYLASSVSALRDSFHQSCFLETTV